MVSNKPHPQTRDDGIGYVLNYNQIEKPKRARAALRFFKSSPSMLSRLIRWFKSKR